MSFHSSLQSVFGSLLSFITLEYANQLPLLLLWFWCNF